MKETNHSPNYDFSNLFILFLELYYISTSLSSYIRHGRHLARFALQHRPRPHHPTGLCVGVGFPENPRGHRIKPLTTAWLWALTLVKNWHSTPGQRTVSSLTSWPHSVHCTESVVVFASVVWCVGAYRNSINPVSDWFNVFLSVSRRGPDTSWFYWFISCVYSFLLLFVQTNLTSTLQSSHQWRPDHPRTCSPPLQSNGLANGYLTRTGTSRTCLLSTAAANQANRLFRFRFREVRNLK